MADADQARQKPAAHAATQRHGRVSTPASFHNARRPLGHTLLATSPDTAQLSDACSRASPHHPEPLQASWILTMGTSRHSASDPVTGGEDVPSRASLFWTSRASSGPRTCTSPRCPPRAQCAAARQRSPGRAARAPRWRAPCAGPCAASAAASSPPTAGWSPGPGSRHISGRCLSKARLLNSPTNIVCPSVHTSRHRQGLC